MRQTILFLSVLAITLANGGAANAAPITASFSGTVLGFQDDFALLPAGITVAVTPFSGSYTYDDAATDLAPPQHQSRELSFPRFGIRGLQRRDSGHHLFNHECGQPR